MKTMQDIKSMLPSHKYYALLELLDCVSDFDVVLRIGYAIIDNDLIKYDFKTIVEDKFNTNLTHFKEQ